MLDALDTVAREDLLEQRLEVAPVEPVLAGDLGQFPAHGRDVAELDLVVGRHGEHRELVLVVRHVHAALRARRRRERWSDEDRRLYRRHRWRSEGYHGEAKTWHGLARAVRRGLQNMRIQAFLTAAAVNLKRLAAALGVPIPPRGPRSA